MAPRNPKDGTKDAQGGLKVAQGGPKMAQDAPKMAPTWPQDGPNMAQELLMVATHRQAKLEGAAVIPAGIVNR